MRFFSALFPNASLFGKRKKERKKERKREREREREREIERKKMKQKEVNGMYN